MKNLKKALLFLLAAIFVLMPLASCKPGGLVEQNGEWEEDVIDPNPQPDTYDYAKSLIPSINFDGRDFRILVCKSVSEFDTQNGDLARNVVAKEYLDIPINDKVYERNTYLQGKLGINIVATEKPFRKVAEELRSSILSMDDRYDICFTRLDDLTPLASQGLLVNLFDMDLNFEEPWWDQNSIDELSIQDELYFAVSDGDIIDKQTTMACMFNKKLMDAQNIEYPYDMVDAGTWTIDAMLEMSSKVKHDADGNGIYDANDVWPILTEYDSATCFYYAFGGYVTQKNDSDEPVLSMEGGNASLAIDKALDVMLDRANVYSVERMSGHSSGTNSWVAASDMFINNQAMFRITNLTTTERWRNMEADFGILPMPKLDENQKNYVHLCKNGATGVCVPNTNENLDFTAICLEAFVSCSRYTLREGYFEATMQGMVSRDEETSRMLNLIFETRAFDLGYIFDFGKTGTENGSGVGYILKLLAADGSKAFASRYDAISDKAQAQIDDMLAALETSREA